MLVTDWQRLDLDATLEVLESWTGQRVVVSIDLAAGPPGLAGMAGILHRTGREDGSLAFELAGSEAWLRLPGTSCFRGATLDVRAHVLVLEFSGADPEDAPAVLVDVQRVFPRSG